MGRATGQDQTLEAVRRAGDETMSVGERLLIVKSANTAVYRRNDRCTVTALTDDGVEVIFDAGATVTLTDQDRYQVITSEELAERQQALERARVLQDGRVQLEKDPKTYRSKGKVRRGRRGTITNVDETTGLVKVLFDKGPEVELDPRIELLKGVGYDEAVSRRQRKSGKEKLAVGMVLELTDDVPGEKTLTKGLRGTIRGFSPDGMVYMDWDGIPVNLSLDPAADPYRIYDSGSSL